MHLSFKDNTWVADLADIQLISKYNKGFQFGICHQYFQEIYMGVLEKVLELLMLFGKSKMSVI